MLGPVKCRDLDHPVLVSLETLVPKDNVYRQLDKALDLSFVREWVKECYADGGPADRGVQVGDPVTDKGEIESGVEIAVEVVEWDEGFKRHGHAAGEVTGPQWTEHGEAFEETSSGTWCIRPTPTPRRVGEHRGPLHHGRGIEGGAGVGAHAALHAAAAACRTPQQADLPSIRVHDLRHTAATYLLSIGTHPKVVQEMLGHSSITLTMDRYSHVLPAMHRQVANEMDALFPVQETG